MYPLSSSNILGSGAFFRPDFVCAVVEVAVGFDAGVVVDVFVVVVAVVVVVIIVTTSSHQCDMIVHLTEMEEVYKTF